MKIMHCDKCGAYIPLGGTFCLECGYRRDALKKCSQCGAILEEGMDYCASCGLPLLKVIDEKICSRCGSPIIKNAKFCIICGVKIESVTNIEHKSFKCPHCKRMNDDPGIFCIYCGERFPGK